MEIEEKVLAYCAQRLEYIARASTQISPEYFSANRQPLFRTIYDIFTKQRCLVSVEILENELKTNAIIVDRRVALCQEFVRLLNTPVNPEEFQYWIDEFKKDYTIRIMKQGVPAILDALDQNNNDRALALYEEVVKKQRLVREAGVIDRRSVRETADERFLQYEQIEANPEAFKGQTIGFKILDDATWGFKPESLNLWVGGTGSGKSVTLMHIATELWRQSKRSIYITLADLSKKEQHQRFDACVSNLMIPEIERGKLSLESKGIYRASLDQLKTAPGEVIIIDPSQCSCYTILAEVEAIQAEKGWMPDALIVDYLNVMRPSHDYSSDWLNQGTIAQDLKELGRTLHCTIHTAAQGVRGLNDMKEDEFSTKVIARSEAIATHCDSIFLLARNEKDKLVHTLRYYTLKSRGFAPVKWKSEENYEKMFISSGVGDFLA
jgi:replicative DNA helicase